MNFVMDNFMQPISGKDITKMIASLPEGNKFRFKYSDADIAPLYTVCRSGPLIIWVSERGRVHASTEAPADQSALEILRCEQSLRYLMNIRSHDTLFIVRM